MLKDIIMKIMEREIEIYFLAVLGLLGFTICVLLLIIWDIHDEQGKKINYKRRKL